MKKIAIFVEGLTEQEFVVSLLKALIGRRGIAIQIGKQFRGKVTVQPISVQVSEHDFFALVIDCSTDSQVKSQIRDQYATLVAASYHAVIGLQDVYPLPMTDLPKLQQSLMLGLPVATVPIAMHLAVMEIEAWFLGERSHYARLDPKLTESFVTASGSSVFTQRADTFQHPTDELNKTYRLANMTYAPKGKKVRWRIRRTIDALCFDTLYAATRNELVALDKFINDIESALFS